MIQFDEHIFQMGWFNHQLVPSNDVPQGEFFGWTDSEEFCAGLASVQYRGNTAELWRQLSGNGSGMKLQELFGESFEPFGGIKNFFIKLDACKNMVVLKESFEPFGC